MKKILPALFLSLFFFVANSQTVSDLRPTVTMKEYVDMQVEMLKALNQLRDAHSVEVNRIKEENIKNAVSTMDKRLDGMNEFREALKDNNSTFIKRSELYAWVITLVTMFFAYANYKKNREGSSSKNIQSGDKVEVKK